MLIFCKRFLIVALLVVGMFGVDDVHAKKTISNADSLLTTVADRSGVSKADVPTVSGQIIKNMLQLTTLIFFILLVYAGMKWMLAQGKEDEITAARKTIIFAGIGLVVVAGAYAITNFVTDRVVEGNDNKGSLLDLENADYTNLGCCFDKVRHPDKFGELRATSWAWRITTQGDCQEQGEKPTTFDAIYGPGTWKFTNVDSQDQCISLYSTFCVNEEDCYDLGF